MRLLLVASKGTSFRHRVAENCRPRSHPNCKQGDAFKQIADTRAIMFCVERESELCAGVISAIGTRDPAAVSWVRHRARPPLLAVEATAEKKMDVLHRDWETHRLCSSMQLSSVLLFRVNLDILILDASSTLWYLRA